MQEIIKQVGSSRQLFETVDFTFMKIFDVLVKTALLGAFLLSLEVLRRSLPFDPAPLEPVSLDSIPGKFESFPKFDGW